MRDATRTGIFGLTALAFVPLDKQITERFRSPSLHSNRFVADTARGLRFAGDPGVLVFGLGLYGVGRLAHRDRMADVGLHTVEAIAISGAACAIAKGAFGRARPFVVQDRDPDDFQLNRGFRLGDRYSSMPSGHATAAFATAAALSAEYSRAPAHSRIVAPLLYTGATLVGLSRIYHDKHWASDIVVSAGLGTLCGAKVVQYHHTHPGNRLDRWLLSASLVPYERGAAVVLPLDSR